MNLHKKIFDILDKCFVFVEDVSRILALAFQGKKNVIIFGPGGHAKSEMVTEALRGLGWENDSFTQFFGEGMDEARLFGGLNFRKLEETQGAGSGWLKTGATAGGAEGRGGGEAGGVSELNRASSASNSSSLTSGANGRLGGGVDIQMKYRRLGITHQRMKRLSA